MEHKVPVDDSKKPDIPKMPYRKYGFFRDDQITFLVTHPGEGLTTLQLEDFRLGINRYLEGQKVGTIGESEGSISAVSFPAFTGEQLEQCHHLLARSQGVTLTSAFSLITASLTGTPDNPLDLMDAIKRLRTDLKEGSPDDSKVVEVEDTKYDLRPGVSIGPIVVEGASLNWLTSVVSQGSGTGGPGSVPAPYYGSRKNAPYVFDVMQKLKRCGIYGSGEGVDIAILDTAPSPHELVAAHKEWPDHPLIKDLLGLGGKLHLYTADYEETLRLTNTSINGSDYRMTDHGLFIAGIIHSIVPKAEIHLFEVLNQYGVGDFQSFTTGLKRALHLTRPGRKLMVSCSWMLDFPADRHQCHHHSENNGEILEDPDLEFERQVLEFAMDDQATLRSMKSLFTRFSVHNRGAVAAAGNDAYTVEEEVEPDKRHVRPLARYPAALSEVVGVGALPITLEKNQTGEYRTSDFSNRSDRPERVGIATLGGEEGEGKGILGLYIGEFPDGRLNTTKWAWWAGTSFATPILTGTVASLYSSSRPPATTEDAINVLRTERIIDGKTKLNEDVLPTTQC